MLVELLIDFMINHGIINHYLTTGDLLWVFGVLLMEQLT